MKLGFVHVFGPCDPANHGIALVPDRYAGLALSLFSFLIFKPNHRDKVNCTSMYTRFGFEVEDYSSTPLPPVHNDPHAWYSDYSSSLAVRFVANYPSIPAYSIDVAKIKAKYSSKPSDPCSAAFWSLLSRWRILKNSSVLVILLMTTSNRVCLLRIMPLFYLLMTTLKMMRCLRKRKPATKEKGLTISTRTRLGVFISTFSDQEFIN
jgi:hypothetical protein